MTRGTGSGSGSAASASSAAIFGVAAARLGRPAAGLADVDEADRLRVPALLRDVAEELRLLRAGDDDVAGRARRRRRELLLAQHRVHARARRRARARARAPPRRAASCRCTSRDAGCRRRDSSARRRRIPRGGCATGGMSPRRPRRIGRPTARLGAAAAARRASGRDRGIGVAASRHARASTAASSGGTSSTDPRFVHARLRRIEDVARLHQLRARSRARSDRAASSRRCRCRGRPSR